MTMQPEPAAPNRRRLTWGDLPSRPDLDVDVRRHVLHGGDTAHAHDFVEIVLVLDGAGSHVTSSGTRSLRLGQVLLIPAGAWHAFTRCQRLTVVNCCLRTRLLDRELLWLGEEPRLRYLLWPAPHEDVLSVHLSAEEFGSAEELLQEMADPPADAARTQQVALLLLLLRVLANALDSDQVAAAERLADAPAVGQALQLLAVDIARPWTVDELANQVALSPAHFSRLFRSTVGQPPMTYLAVLRAEAAAVRLRSTNRPIAEIGEAVGWGNPTYFARRFRARFGMTPREFRHWQEPVSRSEMSEPA